MRTGYWGLVIGCGEGGYKYFPSGYVLLECNLTGLVSCSHISGTLVRLHFVKLDCNLTGLVSCSDILGTLVRLRFVRLRVTT